MSDEPHISQDQPKTKQFDRTDLTGNDFSKWSKESRDELIDELKALQKSNETVDPTNLDGDAKDRNLSLSPGDVVDTVDETPSIENQLSVTETRAVASPDIKPTDNTRIAESEAVFRSFDINKIFSFVWGFSTIERLEPFRLSSTDLLLHRA